MAPKRHPKRGALKAKNQKPKWQSGEIGECQPNLSKTENALYNE
ncbi:hypothetical protein KIPB_011366, partial [Kipferlia bialata]|eukprot:g11366.t1